MVALTLVTALSRRWIATAAGALISGACVASLFLPLERFQAPSVCTDAGPACATSTYTVITLDAALIKGSLSDFIRSTKPDVIVLTGSFHDLTAFDAIFPERMKTRDNNITIFSRLPLRRIEENGFGSQPWLTVELGSAHPFRLTAVQTHAPMSAATWDRRNLYFDLLADVARTNIEAGPTLLVGNLDAPPYSPRMARLLRHAGLRFSDEAWLPGGTAPGPMGWNGARQKVDYILADRTVGLKRCRVLHSLEADHKPNLCEVVIPHSVPAKPVP